MAQFNPETAQSPPSREGARQALPEALRQNAPIGPRLVGGTSFHDQSGLDLAQIQVLAQACLQGLDAARQVVFGWQRQGLSLEDIYLQGITPCARLLGEWWCSDRLDFAMTTIAASHLQQLLHDFSAEFLQESQQPRLGLSVLLLSEPGAQHSMGLFMLSEFFKRAGWNVTLVNPLDMNDFKRNFQADWFDVIGLSLSTERHLPEIQAALPELLKDCVNTALQVFVGGPVASFAPEKITWTDTHLLKGNALQAVESVTQTLFNMERQINVTP